MKSTKQQARAKNRRTKVGPLYLVGWTQTKLAKEFGVSQMTISNDIKAIRKLWTEQTTIDIDAHINEMIARNNSLIDECLRAYHRSLRDSEVATKRKGKGEKGHIDITEMTRAKRDGDSIWIRQIVQLQQENAKILGLYARDKREQKWTDEVIQSLKTGELSPGEVIGLWPDMAGQFFIEAGIDIEKTDDEL